ncbi:flagellar type III secretion system pore protein FliP [Telmatospirillum sp.]|uniref:flagellar type III secretion system pore protein FliP n=1 Tax=Telmatospirillum sp. TaxID=2079197 RepID=UPI00283AC133|nr:flagellar type III secretion system pore protein FliP [Telmatospirillum sp.]MDR3438080.1 flagellar type III secretion system pore protein FliP [Telmatospirillum sp.]
MRAGRKILVVAAVGAALLPGPLFAADLLAATGSHEIVRAAVIIAILTVLPTIIVAMTSFTRIIIVLSMVRHAFGMPETPPNAVLISLGLFLTLFSMGPVAGELNKDALQPYLANQISVQDAFARGSAPLRRFMLAQTRDDDLATIYRASHTPLPATPDRVELVKLVPAFMINELRVGFTIGFVILLPFLLIDLVVAATLLSMGMMMVPPTTISLPIKLLMFVLIDGWALIVEGVLGSFR